MIGLILASMIQTPAEAPLPEFVTLGDIRMHLFYAETGRLSPDISPPNEFAAWNTVIGGGAAEEQADDLAVVVELRSDGDQPVRQPLVITAQNARGRMLGQRRFVDGLTGENGRAYYMLYLPNVGCAGEIRVTATFGRHVRRETLALNCGE
jgi:hypothetical protein